MTPHICPVCCGTGEVWRYGTEANDTQPEPCHACNGRGYVVVSDVEHVVQPVYALEIHAT